ncbi:hypothetical protein [Thermococcus sp. AM4]|uniref:hypothetical protein n=1 Tax=Thermococcus sp. (strain AM4) TaxID=246969 RepID=UPI0001870802|nr:hypothetical protein [Thermococcus sp. AM4]EEB73274.1 conserved hypothetical protein [Thermococcus sp. AM4]
MKHSRIAIKIIDAEEPVFYDPVFHGRTLKVFGMDDWPAKALEYVVSAYRKLDYGTIVFDTEGSFPREGFDTIIEVRDGSPAGLDPITLASRGVLDGYTAATIVQTAYGLDRVLTERLYADFMRGKVRSVPEALSSGEKYAEVIAESYTPLDEALFSGDAPEFGRNVLVDLGGAYSITVASLAFLIVSAVVRHRRKTVVAVNDAAVLAYTEIGSAAVPLITKPLRGRVTVLGTNYVVDSIMNLSGPTLVLYHEPDTQSVIYEANGVPPGPMRRYVQKDEGAFVYRTPETINVEWGEVPF